MSLEDQLVFLFSALGGVNGLFLSAYFAFFIKQRNEITYSLSALLLVISIRVTKSAFFAFYDNISTSFIEIGLLACLLIGPFLYLHVRSTTDKKYASWNWLIHIVPIIIAMVFIVQLFPYREHRYMWSWSRKGVLGIGLYTIWFSYIFSSIFLARASFKKVFLKSYTPNNKDVWLVNVILGVFVVSIAYFTSGYTSYVVGALSFSFIFYISMLIWIFKKGAVSVFFEQQEKYGSKKIEDSEFEVISEKLNELFVVNELYKNPELKITDVAKEIGIIPNYLSQYLNEHLKKSFSTFVNEYRVKAAEQMLTSNHSLSIEGIGIESGFKSNSTFYTAFRKLKGITPGEYKKNLN